MDLEKIKDFAKKHLEKNDRGHGWQHTRRVLKLCEKINEEEGADLEVLRIAALLHDIGHHKDKDRHAAISAELAEEVLENYDKREEVLHCIRTHRFSDDRKAETLEAKILQDADRLDAMGAVGVARTMMYSGANNRPIYLPEKKFSGGYDGESETAVEHFHDKLLKIKERLKTETAREIGEHRHCFMEEFLAQLEKEWEGER
ncbi:MAG: HD domain-containing protein [Candidatus Aenigmatarchaeota archaeon]